jgi:hypothetical protein
MENSSVIDKINVISEQIKIINGKPEIKTKIIDDKPENNIKPKIHDLINQIKKTHINHIENNNLGKKAATITTSDTTYDNSGNNLGETNKSTIQLIDNGDSFKINKFDT